MSGPLSEDDLIARFFAPLAAPEGFGLKDDVARLAPRAGEELALKADAIVAGVHFFPDDPPDAIARKALRVNLSDLAAKGARPIGFLLTLALPTNWTVDWLERFAQGLGDDASFYQCPLFGGDTVGTPGPLTVAITVFGAVRAGRIPTRMDARPGDRLYVTGTIGDAALGLRLRLGRLSGLDGEKAEFLRGRYLLPEPRCVFAPTIERYANAAMDVSDGFVGDLTKMLRVSGVGAEIDLRLLPLSSAARAALAADPGLFETVATGGDDYELIAAVAPASCKAFEAAAAAAGVAVTTVGEVTERGGGARWLGRDGKPVAFAKGSFSHF